MESMKEQLQEQSKEQVQAETQEQAPEIALTKKQKIFKKIKEKVTNPVDMKYRGPLSYRYLRILAWMFFAIGQLLVLHDLFDKISYWHVLGDGPAGPTIVGLISSLATPLFIIASFGVALSGQKTYKKLVLTYGAIFGAMVIALNIFYYRYLVGMLGNKENANVVLNSMGFITRANVFTDLFIFSLFHFFVNFVPAKHFKGKKIYLFRAMVAIPIAYVITAYVLKTLNNFATINLPFAIFPFLLTKSPIVFVIFALMSLALKYRRNFFINKIGLTQDEYKHFLTTNRNSFSFSVWLTILIVVFAIIEVIIFAIFYSVYGHEGTIGVLVRLTNCSIGEVISMVLVIPFIFLYSYTRSHKEGPVDILVPLMGIAMVVIVYMETIYHFMTMPW